jgi:hypothetical protein
MKTERQNETPEEKIMAGAVSLEYFRYSVVSSRSGAQALGMLAAQAEFRNEVSLRTALRVMRVFWKPWEALPLQLIKFSGLL